MNEEIDAPIANKSIFTKLSQLLSSEPSSRADIIELLKIGFDKGLIESDSYSIIQGGLTVSEMQVRDIMIPRSKMVSVSYSNDLNGLLEPIITSQHSRFPVTSEDSSEVLGILLAKDLLPILAAHRNKVDLRELMRPAVFVPESKRLNALLKEFRESRNHMAIVIDEYGAIDGLVTIEDVLEQIVGDIADEHDFEDDNSIKATKAGDYLVKAATSLKDFNQFFTTEFDDDEFDTIGGLVVHEFGRLPKRTEAIHLNGYLFRVLHADNRKVRLLQVTLQAKDEPLRAVKL